MVTANTQEPKFCFFLTLVEVQETCVCRNHSEIIHDYLYNLVKSTAVYDIVVGVLGLVPTFLALLITLKITRKRDDLEHNEKSDFTDPGVSNSVKALLMSAVSAFNMLRLVALLVLGVNTLLDRRQAVQKIANMLWLFGTWGVTCFTLDLCFATCAEISTWARMRKLFYTYQKTTRRAAALILAGMILHGKTFAHVFIGRCPHCDNKRFWWVYERSFSLKGLMTLHYAVPTLLLIVLLIRLLVHVLQWRRGHLLDNAKLPECFIMSLSAWHAASHLLATIYYLYLMTQYPHLPTRSAPQTGNGWLNAAAVASDLFCSLNAASSVFLYFLWHNFRQEVIDVMRFGALFTYNIKYCPKKSEVK